jgi:hypothetical protein
MLGGGAMATRFLASAAPLGAQGGGVSAGHLPAESCLAPACLSGPALLTAPPALRCSPHLLTPPLAPHAPCPSCPSPSSPSQPRKQARVLGSEAAQEEEDPQEAQLRAAAARMMGDLGTSGDAPFGGEVSAAPDSQVRTGGSGRAGGRAGGKLRCKRAVAIAASASPPAPPPSCPLPLFPQVYWWHEKYRPRRPKYFNRVHTG